MIHNKSKVCEIYYLISTLYTKKTFKVPDNISQCLQEVNIVFLFEDVIKRKNAKLKVPISKNGLFDVFSRIRFIG